MEQYVQRPEKLTLSDSIKNIIFVSDGGLGRVIASTAVVAQLKRCFPDKKIFVLSGSLEVYMNNPNVERTYSYHNPLYFYDQYVNPESFIIHAEPYRHPEYLHGDLHLIDAWCDLIGIPRPESKTPELYFLRNEKRACEIFVKKTTQNRKHKLALLQWVGGIVPNDKSEEQLLDALSRMNKRALPQVLAQQIVNSLTTRGYKVISIQHENFPQLEGVEMCKTHIRNILSLIHEADAFIGIDSFMQHAMASAGKAGVVAWGGTNPKRLGYAVHKNLNKVRDTEGHLGCKMVNCHRPNSYIFDTNPSGFPWNCPVDEACMEYELKDIMDAFDNLYKEPVTAEVVPVPVEQPQS